jgi:L,D-transpeptidase catalytic domain
MKLLALAFLMGGCLISTAAFAGDIAAQPLTRADCDRAGMLWDDSSNVCASTLQQSQTAPSAVAAINSVQPLTREDCDAAGMSWSDTNNVCAAPAEGSAAGPQDAAMILIIVDKSSQRMRVSIDGIEQYSWPVSTGGPGYDTPSGTFNASSMNEI